MNFVEGCGAGDKEGRRGTEMGGEGEAREGERRERRGGKGG